ncbi:hypothetical protein Ppa05_60350 [Planomonospora parontospora subsp. antibiotica]|nr:hypothetical protein Ppa05_60350 [Planomonospora parontospora subsp. antibiotica]
MRESMHGLIRRSPLRMLRSVLLVALALGIAGMHTLGHLEHEAGHGDTPGLVAPAPFPDHKTFEAEAAPSGAMTVHDGTQMRAAGDAFPRFDPVSVCLAVLTSVPLLIAAMALRWTWRSPHSGAARTSAALVAARPPPRRTARRLAHLSVLRI